MIKAFWGWICKASESWPQGIFSIAYRAKDRVGPFKTEDGKAIINMQTCIALNEKLIADGFNQKDASTTRPVELPGLAMRTLLWRRRQWKETRKRRIQSDERENATGRVIMRNCYKFFNSEGWGHGAPGMKLAPKHITKYENLNLKNGLADFFLNIM